MAIKSPKVLVTGGAGFIGSFLVDELVKQGYRVTIFDNLEPQVHPNGLIPNYLNRDAEFVKGDVRDYEALKKVILDSEIIFHMAAAVGVGQSQYEIKRYVDVNVGGTANLLDVLANNKHSVNKLIVAASMSSYGEGKYRCNTCGLVRPLLRPEKQMLAQDWELRCPECSKEVAPIPTDEEATQNCNSIYGITKKVQEDMVLNIGKAYNIPSVALRFFNVYGPRQSLSNPYTGVLAIFMSRIKNGHKPVIYEDGLQSRDFISIHDIVKACIVAMKSETANYQVFNVGTGKPLTIKEVALKLAEFYGSTIEPEITNRFRKGDVRHCYADITRINKSLGFTPGITFETGICELIEWSKSAESVDKFDKAAEELAQKGLIQQQES